MERDLENRKSYMLNPFRASIFAKKVFTHHETHGGGGGGGGYGLKIHGRANFFTV